EHATHGVARNRPTRQGEELPDRYLFAVQTLYRRVLAEHLKRGTDSTDEVVGASQTEAFEFAKALLYPLIKLTNTVVVERGGPGCSRPADKHNRRTQDCADVRGRPATHLRVHRPCRRYDETRAE